MHREPPHHRCRVLGTPWDGVYCTHIDSARHYGRHWHATYGMGFVEHGTQRSASGRGNVEAYPGDVITTNPGEVHDGRPLGGPSRRWRIVYFDPSVLASTTSVATGDAAITQPVIHDATLRHALRRLFARLEDHAEKLACEEAPVEACALLLDRYTTAAPVRETRAEVRHVRDRLADESADAPTLAELAAMAGLSKYQVLRRFQQAFGVPPHAGCSNGGPSELELSSTMAPASPRQRRRAASQTRAT